MPQKKGKPTAAAPRRTQEVPFIAACSHLTRKNTRFCAPASSPKTKPMQLSCSHYNAFRSITSQTCTYLRTWQHQMTTIMQRFQCELQPQIPKHPITTHAQAHPKQLEATVTVPQTKKRQTDRSRTRRTREVPFIAACSHFTRKNASFRSPASSPKQSPCNIHAATTMRFAAFPSSPLPFVTASLSHHFPSSPLPFVTTHPSSPLPFVTTFLRHHPVS